MGTSNEGGALMIFFGTQYQCPISVAVKKFKLVNFDSPSNIFQLLSSNALEHTVYALLRSECIYVFTQNLVILLKPNKGIGNHDSHSYL